MEDLLQQDIKIEASAIVSLILTAIILFVLPIIVTILWKKRCGKSVSLTPLIFGAVGFIVSVQVLEQGVHMLCLVLDSPISRFLNDSTPAYVIYGAFMAGIFEECGRYIIIRFLMKKDKTRENMVMYGIGHGGIEVWSVSLMSVVNLLIIIFLIQLLGMDKALPILGVTSETSESFAAVISSGTNFSISDGGLSVLERIMAMAVHISLTVMVAYGIEKNKLIYLFLAILAHALTDLFPVLYQRGIVGLLVTELWICLCAVVFALWSRRLYKNMKLSPKPKTETIISENVDIIE